MYEVGGFAFDNEKEAERAKKEIDGIKYIKAQTKMDDPDVVLKLYNTLIQKKYFKTQVGIAFLVELQEYLHTIPYVKNEEIWNIPIHEKNAPEPEIVVKTVVKQSKIAVFFSVVFALIILGMFTISYYSRDNVNIINYENAIINKYESWEAELTEREKLLDEREAALGEGTE